MSDVDRQQRQAYLDALEIDTWSLRGSDDGADQPPEAAIAGQAEGAVDAEAGTSAPVDVAASDWTALRAAVTGCRLCRLHEGRTQTVFGVGDPDADWMIVGEAPGAEEDRRGEPFVGRAGRS